MRGRSFTAEIRRKNLKETYLSLPLFVGRSQNSVDVWGVARLLTLPFVVKLHLKP